MVVWSGKIYAPDYSLLGVSRSQSGEFISCSDKNFSKGVWISDEDFASLMNAFQLLRD